MNGTNKILLTAVLFAGILMPGCYTKVMSPHDFIQTRRAATTVSQHRTDHSSVMNFQQSCVSCHSVVELDERAEELGLYGIRTVHNGSLLAAHQWREETSSIYVREPNPYWPSTPGRMNPWWSPTVSTAVSTPTSTAGETDRPRTDGVTRDDRRSTGTYTQPQAPVGGSTSAPPASTPPTTTVTAPPATATPAATTDRNSNSSGSSNESSTRTRTDGGTRDDRSRPR